MINTIIRNALNDIGIVYSGGERAWLQEKNPLAMRLLDGLAERVDVVALSGDEVALKRAVLAWVQNWKFWCRNYKVQTGRDNGGNKKNEQL